MFSLFTLESSNPFRKGIQSLVILMATLTFRSAPSLSFASILAASWRRVVFNCLPLLALSLLACDSSPVAPVEIMTVDRTAIFDSLQVDLTAINYSWMPTEGPIPSSDPARVTIEITALCYALGTCTIDPSEFRYRTWDGLRAYERRYTSLWSPHQDGREPTFDAGTLRNGEVLRGWMTFLVPTGVSFLPDEFLWQPDPRVSFSFHLPTSSGSLVCGVASIFGRVTDAAGAPVAFAPLDLSLYNLFRPENTFEGGECRGENAATSQSTTDAEGRFDFQLGFRFCEERCAVLEVSAPNGSDLEGAAVSAGTLWPSPGHPLVEPSELRIDVTLPHRQP